MVVLTRAAARSAASTATVTRVSFYTLCDHEECVPDITDLQFNDVASVKKYKAGTKCLKNRQAYISELMTPYTEWDGNFHNDLFFDGEHLLQLSHHLNIDKWSDKLDLMQPGAGTHTTKICISCPLSMSKTVYVKTLTGRMYPILVDSAMNMDAFFDAVAAATGAFKSQIGLTVKGRLLEKHSSVSELSDEATVLLVLQMRGGMHHPSSGHKDFCSYATLDPDHSGSGNRNLSITYIHPMTKTKESLKVYCGSDCEIQTVIDFLRMEIDSSYFEGIAVEKRKSIALGPWSELLSRAALQRLTRAIAHGVEPTDNHTSASAEEQGTTQHNSHAEGSKIRNETQDMKSRKRKGAGDVEAVALTKKHKSMRV